MGAIFRLTDNGQWLLMLPESEPVRANTYLHMSAAAYTREIMCERRITAVLLACEMLVTQKLSLFLRIVLLLDYLLLIKRAR